MKRFATIAAGVVLSLTGSTMALDAYTTNTSGQLWKFDTANPAGATLVGLITGLAPGAAPEQVLGIDFRPATGVLYAMGSTGRVYTLDTNNAQATVVTGTPFALNGSFYGFDFNPTVDRIRVTSSNNQNFRVHPVTGNLVATDTDLHFANENSPVVVGSAYTNNFIGAGSTTLYDIDVRNQALLIQNPPNDGVVTLVGGLGFSFTGEAGFDIYTDFAAANHAFAVLNVDTSRGLPGSGFYTIDLGTGAATFVGELPVNGGVFRSLALIPAPGAAIVAGLSLVGIGLRRRR